MTPCWVRWRHHTRKKNIAGIVSDQSTDDIIQLYDHGRSSHTVMHPPVRRGDTDHTHTPAPTPTPAHVPTHPPPLMMMSLLSSSCGEEVSTNQAGVKQAASGGKPATASSNQKFSSKRRETRPVKRNFGDRR